MIYDGKQIGMGFAAPHGWCWSDFGHHTSQDMHGIPCIELDVAMRSPAFAAWAVGRGIVGSDGTAQAARMAENTAARKADALEKFEKSGAQVAGRAPSSYTGEHDD